MIQSVASLIVFGLIGLVFVFIGYTGIINRQSDEFHNSPLNRSGNSPLLNVVSSSIMIAVGLVIMSLGIIPIFT